VLQECYQERPIRNYEEGKDTTQRALGIEEREHEARRGGEEERGVLALFLSCGVVARRRLMLQQE
jgi:hypothetical protein